MTAHANPTQGVGLPPPSPATPKRRWYVDEIVVAAFAFLGFGSGVFLPLHYGFNVVPPIVVSFLLATGIAALTYRYLGGIEGASFTVGALKLSGTLAALVGIAMLINGQLLHQIEPARVWYLDGSVIDQTRTPIKDLDPADFTVFPLARPEQLGEFHLQFIRDTTPGADRPYLQVGHKKLGPVTIPLEVDQLKKLYPDATIQDNRIKIDHIILPEGTGAEAPYAEGATPPQPLQQGPLDAYTSAAQSAQPAAPITGGVPR